MRAIGLDCLTLPDVTPLRLIYIAAETGYPFVSLWVNAPALYEPMLADPATKADIVRAVSDTGVKVGNLEVFNLLAEGEIANYEGSLAFGASLGAKTATAIAYGAPRGDLSRRLAQFDALCIKHGLATLVEPISMGVMRTIADGLALIDEAGIEGALVVDALHVMRTGGSPETLASIPPAKIGHFQICDGLITVPEDQLGLEATADRLYPGDGEFPLEAFMSIVPADATIGVEVPNLERQARLTPIERAREALRAAREIAG